MQTCQEIFRDGLRCGNAADWKCANGGWKCHEHSHTSRCCQPLIRDISATPPRVPLRRHERRARAPSHR